MYRPATVLRLAKALTIAGVSRAKGYVLTDTEVSGMKTLQSLLAKRWVVPVQDPSARRLPTARQQSADGAFEADGTIDTSYMTDSSANNSVKYTAMPTYLNPQTLQNYAVDNVPYALTGTIAGQAAGSVVLNWYAPANSPASLTDYVVQYKLSSATSWTTFSDGTSTATTATVTGLTSLSVYDFRVAAVIGGTTGSYSNTFTIDPN
jgi:hypothetical protein